MNNLGRWELVFRGLMLVPIILALGFAYYLYVQVENIQDLSTAVSNRVEAYYDGLIEVKRGDVMVPHKYANDYESVADLVEIDDVKVISLSELVAIKYLINTYCDAMSIKSEPLKLESVYDSEYLNGLRYYIYSFGERRLKVEYSSVVDKGTVTYIEGSAYIPDFGIKVSDMISSDKDDYMSWILQAESDINSDKYADTIYTLQSVYEKKCCYYVFYHRSYKGASEEARWFRINKETSKLKYAGTYEDDGRLIYDKEYLNINEEEVIGISMDGDLKEVKEVTAVTDTRSTDEKINELTKQLKLVTFAAGVLAVCTIALGAAMWNSNRTLAKTIQNTAQLANSVSIMVEKDNVAAKIAEEVEESTVEETTEAE